MKRIMYWLQRGIYCMVSQEDDTVTFYDTEEDEYVNVWKDYFDMDRDYSAICDIMNDIRVSKKS